MHCCVVLSQAAEPVPAARLAEFHGISRTYLAKHLQAALPRRDRALDRGPGRGLRAHP